MDALLTSSTWELIILENIAWSFILLAPVVFYLLGFVKAPYGRYGNNASKWWGPDIPARLAWIVQELPSAFWPLFFLIKMPPESRAATVILFLFFIHYFHRTFIYSFRIRSKNPTKFVPFIGAFIFCSINGYMQSAYLAKYFTFSATNKNVLFFTMGFLIFSTGILINIHSDGILRNLRKPGEQGHKIPYGGLFEKVSGANFFGEIVEWWGFSCMSLFSLPSLAFAIFTFANIGRRGWHHHNYYLTKFDNYPKSRKAVIPYLW